MIRFVEGVGFIGGVNWMPPGMNAGNSGLFGALLSDAAGASRGGTGLATPNSPLDRAVRDRDRDATGFDTGGGVPPLEPRERPAGNADRPRAERDSSTSPSRSTDQSTPRDATGADTDRAEQADRNESRTRRHERSGSRETAGAAASSDHAAEAEHATAARAEAQSMAANPSALATNGTAASSAASSIRLIAQPGGELGMSIGSAGQRGINASAERSPATSKQIAANAEAVLRAASRGINSALAQRGGTITIRLIPETLGALRVQVEVDAGRVSVRIEATNAQAAELLNANTASLRQSLESRGMQVERILVSTPNAEAPRPNAGNDPSRSDTDGQDAQQHTARDQQDADSPEQHQGRHGPERSIPAPARSPMERFGERLRLMLDGIG